MKNPRSPPQQQQQEEQEEKNQDRLIELLSKLTIHISYHTYQTIFDFQRKFQIFKIITLLCEFMQKLFKLQIFFSSVCSLYIDL